MTTVTLTEPNRPGVTLMRNFDPAQGCAWCGEPFRDYTNKNVPPARFYPIFVRRTIKFLGQKYRVAGCVDGNCDEFLMEHQYGVRTKLITA